MNPNFRNYLAETYDNPEYQRIIFGVLKRLHINFYHPERPDFEQEARLIMAQAMDNFESVHVEPTTDRQKARNLYLYQHLYWRLLDRLRVQQRQRERIQLSIDQESNSQNDESASISLEKIFRDFSADRQFSRCETDHFFKTLLNHLTTQQRRYLELLYLGYQPNEIAARLHISKQTVTNLRRRVIKCGRALLNDG